METKNSYPQFVDNSWITTTNNLDKSIDDMTTDIEQDIQKVRKVKNMDFDEAIKEKKIEHNTRDTRTKVINPYLGEEKIFNTIKEACEEYDINYNNVKEYFFRKKTKQITYKGLIFIKLD